MRRMRTKASVNDLKKEITHVAHILCRRALVRPVGHFDFRENLAKGAEYSLLTEFRNVALVIYSIGRESILLMMRLMASAGLGQL
jgi:hypothetical protein